MLKKYLVAGLLIWLPIGVTIWVLRMVIRTMDSTLALLPPSWQPDAWLGRDIPGLGFLFAVIVIFVTGLLAANFVGAQLFRLHDRIIARIPIVRSIYSSVKQVSDTVLSPQGNAFRKALLIEYPRKGSWSIGFLTGAPAEEVARHIHAWDAPSAASKEHAGTDAADLVSVYVPTTPNPTSGFFLMMRRDQTRELDMSVDSALKHIVSMGVVAPGNAFRDTSLRKS